MASLPLQESAVFILHVQHLTPSSAPQRLCAEQQLKGEARKHLEGKTYTKKPKKREREREKLSSSTMEYSAFLKMSETNLRPRRSWLGLGKV